MKSLKAVVVLLVATAAGQAGERVDWDGAYFGASISGASVGADFASNGRLPAASHRDGGVGFGLHLGYGTARGAVYLGGEIDGQLFGGGENSDWLIVGSLPGMNPPRGIGSAIVGAAGGPCIGACAGSVIGSAVGASGAPHVVGETGDTLEAVEAEIEAVLAMRARIGVPVGRFLPYVSAGVAAGHVDAAYLRLDEVRLAYPDGTSGRGVQGAVQSKKEVAFGYTVGAGAEMAISPRLALRAEYSFTDLGDVDFEVAERGYRASVDTTLHQARLGLALRF